MSLFYCNIKYEHREILLKDRPRALYDVSPKGTVPVLILDNNNIIDESIDIMKWALKIFDKDSWYKNKIEKQDKLISVNDNIFKKKLDNYKYHIRFPELSFEEHRKIISKDLSAYNNILSENKYLLSSEINLADIAIFPFIRQSAFVNINWFKVQFPFVYNWLQSLMDSNLFQSIMHKYPIWKEGENKIIVNDF
jgi:glutathione S-transferase